MVSSYFTDCTPSSRRSSCSTGRRRCSRCRGPTCRPRRRRRCGRATALAAASLTWLQPLTTTAVARGRVQLLALPPDVYHEHCKLPAPPAAPTARAAARTPPAPPRLRRHRAPRARVRRRAPRRPPRARSSARSTPCTGLAVLASGSASVTVQLHKVGVGDGDDGDGEAAAVVAHIAAPELLGVIDVLSAVLDRGREARRDTARREAAAAVAAARSGGPRLAPRGEALTPSPSSSSAAARKAAAPVTATHGASVVRRTHCERLSRCEPRNCCVTAGALVARAGGGGEARGSVREVLRHEITRQRRQQAQRAHFEAMYLSQTSTAKDAAAAAAAAAGLQRPPSRSTPPPPSRGRGRGLAAAASSPALRQTAADTGRPVTAPVPHRPPSAALVGLDHVADGGDQPSRRRRRRGSSLLPWIRKLEAIDDNQAPVALAATGGAAGGGRSKVDAMLAALLRERGPAAPEATATSTAGPPARRQPARLHRRREPPRRSCRAPRGSAAGRSRRRSTSGRSRRRPPKAHPSSTRSAARCRRWRRRR